MARSLIQVQSFMDKFVFQTCQSKKLQLQVLHRRPFVNLNPEINSPMVITGSGRGLCQWPPWSLIIKMTSNGRC